MTALMNTDVGFLQINGNLICLIVASFHYGSMSCISRLPLSILCFSPDPPSHSKKAIVPYPSRTVREPQNRCKGDPCFLLVSFCATAV